MSLKRNYGEMYAKLHQDKPKYFSGKMSRGQIRAIAELIELVKPDRLLDYGSGKGYQYLVRRVQDHWGGLLPYCYDPGVIQMARKPEGTFAGVICTDVMEHIDPADIDMILADLFASLHPTGPVFAYFHISVREAHKEFDDGENVHLTIQPPEWWDKRLARFERADLTIRATYGD